MDRRIVGVDVARCLALLGMITAHVLSLAGEEGGWLLLVSGRSAALFAVLAGVSIALVTDPRRRDAAYHPRALLGRALSIAVLGLLLGLFPSGVAVILTYYGVLFLLALPVLRWRARWLWLLAVGWALLAPLLSMLVRPHLPAPSYQVPNPLSFADPWQLATELLFTGYYPVFTWGAYLFAGLAAARSDLSRAAVSRWLLVLGGWTAVLTLGAARWLTGLSQARAALVASYDRREVVQGWPDLVPVLQDGLYGTTPTGSWWWLTVWSPHSGSVVDMVHTTAFSLGVLGLCLTLVRWTGPAARRAWQVAFGAGTMTLTLYAGHVLVLSLPEEVPGAHHLAVHVGLVLAVGAAFVLTGHRGPLESVVGDVARGGPRPSEGAASTGQSGTGSPR